ncbi:MAG: Flp family type IVb pilin [Rhodospirillaceae bacterium]|nr:Flp family type IVb pilin [Rhodospirillaceae bacterium]
MSGRKAKSGTRPTGASRALLRGRAFLRDEKGATAIEYALIAALVAVAIIVALEALGTSLGGLYDSVAGKVTAKMPK